MATPLEQRIAMARLEAALVQEGYADHEEVAVRIAKDEDPEEVLKGLEEACSAQLQADGKVPNRCARLDNLYRADAPTHAVAEATNIEVPAVVADALKAIRPRFADSNEVLDPTQLGWTIAADPASKNQPGILLRIMSAKAPRGSRPHIGSFSRKLSDGLGVPVRLDVGMQAHSQNKWAHENHGFACPGISVGRPINGNQSTGATLTVPVRPNSPLPPLEEGMEVPTCWFITAAHPFHQPSTRSKTVHDVFQPATSDDPDRFIGRIIGKEYSHAYKANNLIDAVLVTSNITPGRHFGKDTGHSIAGVWDGEINDQHKTYIYGASSGLLAVRVDFMPDVVATMLASDGTRLVYRDLIEFSLDSDGTKPASARGDSGAPLLVRQGNRFYLAGMVVGGGVRQAKGRRPRSYAVPIDRILMHFDLGIW